jgi:hypothetical protein
MRCSRMVCTESNRRVQRVGNPHLHVVWVSRRHGGFAPCSASLRSCSAISARRDPPVNASPTRNLIRAGQRRLSRRRALLQQIEDVDGETLITINELQFRSLPLALRGLRLGVAFPLLHLWFFVREQEGAGWGGWWRIWASALVLGALREAVALRVLGVAGGGRCEE